MNFQKTFFSRKGAKAQSLPGSMWLSLRLCAFAGKKLFREG